MSEKETVDVVIDSNEASQKPELVEILVMHEDVDDYRIEPLPEGDIIIEDCMFERKTPSDFASSLQKGRLRDQVERMAGREHRPYILVEGDMQDFGELEHTEIPAKSLRGMDASIEAKNQISVKYCSTIGNVADMAVRLARKQKEGVDTVQARQTKAITDPTFIEEVYLSIDKVGVKTAEKLAVAFPSLEMALQADREEFEEVEGIGSELSEKIHQALHTDISEDSDGIEKQTEDTKRKMVTI